MTEDVGVDDVKGGQRCLSRLISNLHGGRSLFSFGENDLLLQNSSLGALLPLLIGDVNERRSKRNEMKVEFKLRATVNQPPGAKENEDRTRRQFVHSPDEGACEERWEIEAEVRKDTFELIAHVNVHRGKSNWRRRGRRSNRHSCNATKNK